MVKQSETEKRLFFLKNLKIQLTLILSTLASSFSCSTNRRMLDKLELEVMSARSESAEKNLS